MAEVFSFAYATPARRMRDNVPEKTMWGRGERAELLRVRSVFQSVSTHSKMHLEPPHTRFASHYHNVARQ